MTTHVANPLIPEQTRVLIAEIDTASTGILEAIVDSTVDNDEDYEAATDVLKQVKRMGNELESARTSITKPMNENLREINRTFSDVQAKLDIVEKRMKNLSASYVAKKQAEQQALLAEAARAAQQAAAADSVVARDDARAKIAQAYTVTAPTVSGISHTERWTWSLIDIGAVPREYLIVDDAKVSAAVRAGERNIPGIRIFPMTQTRVVAGK